MADTAKLVAVLEVRLDKLEKQLERAGNIAEREAKKIEGHFLGLNVRWGFGQQIAEGIISGVKDAVTQIIAQFKRIEDAAKLTGISMNQAFALEKVIGESALPALASIATMLDRIGRSENNDLKKLFAAQPTPIDVATIKDAGEAYEKVVNIIANAKNLIQAREIGKLFGFSNTDVDRIIEVGDAFGDLAKKARESLPDLTRLSVAAREFEFAWKTASENAGKAIQNEMVKTLKTTVKELELILTGIVALAEWTGLKVSAADPIREWIKSLKEFREGVEKAGSTPPSSGPAQLKTGGTSNTIPIEKEEKARLNAFEREVRRAKEREGELNKEAELIGLGTFERTKALEVLRLEQMALRDSLTIDEARRAQIDKIADGYARATLNLERGRQAQQLQSFLGNELVNALDKATVKGARFADIMEDIVGSLKRAALQALILGQGPLAGVFGASGESGGLVGGIAKLFKDTPTMQEGGMVPGKGPVPIVAHGGEIILPANIARALGSKSTSQGMTISVVGARGNAEIQQMVAAGVQQGIAAYDRVLPAKLSDIRVRYG